MSSLPVPRIARSACGDGTPRDDNIIMVGAVCPQWWQQSEGLSWGGVPCPTWNLVEWGFNQLRAIGAVHWRKLGCGITTPYIFLASFLGGTVGVLLDRRAYHFCFRKPMHGAWSLRRRESMATCRSFAAVFRVACWEVVQPLELILSLSAGLVCVFTSTGDDDHCWSFTDGLASLMLLFGCPGWDGKGSLYRA